MGIDKLKSDLGFRGIMRHASLVLSLILLPTAVLHAETYRASMYGIIADGKTDNAKALQEMIDGCSSEGGGMIVIDRGTVVSSMISLKDNVTLEIAEGAVLKGTDRMEDYPHVPVDFITYYPKRRCFLYAQNQTNIAVIGKGTLDGNGGAFNPGTSESSRVSLIRFDGCTGVTIKEITLINASMWTQHIYRCDKVRISGITVNNMAISAANDDGLNIDGSHDVVIENCRFDTHDDCVTMKNTSHRGCRDVSISNCWMRTHKSSFKFGTESYHGFENITARDLDIGGGRDGIALASVDGAHMKNILVENVTVTDATCPIFLRLGARLRKIKDDPQELTVGSAQGICIRNVTATGARRAVLVSGLVGHPIKDVILENINVTFDTTATDLLAPDKKAGESGGGYPQSGMFGRLNSWGVYVRHAENVLLKNLNLTSARGLDPDRMVHIEDVQGLYRK